VTEGLKTQESFHQDISTWLHQRAGISKDAPPLFYPSWEILPHEERLPHADVISERLETLLSLRGKPKGTDQPANVVTTSVTAFRQRCFAPDATSQRTKMLRRGDRSDPLDLVEWLEAQGYEPEAQVTQKGEIALRGGILDLFPLTSPWPVRLEFFGDELESLRHFDPLTQLSREEIPSVTIPPGGELGILKKLQSGGEGAKGLATLLDYLPNNSIFL